MPPGGNELARLWHPGPLELQPGARGFACSMVRRRQPARRPAVDRSLKMMSLGVLPALVCCAVYASVDLRFGPRSSTIVAVASPRRVTTVASEPSPEVTVPNVVGQNYGTAQVKLATLGPRHLGLGVDYRLRHDAAMPAGDVLAQSVSAGTAVAALTDVTLTVSIGPARAPGAKPCGARALRAQPAMRVSEETGQDTLDWALANESSSTCVLYGYPQVSLWDRAGHLLRFAYSHKGDQMTTGAEPSPVYLPPGGSAWIRVNKYRCDIAATDISSAMVLGLPNGGGNLDVPADFTYCDETASLTVTVSPFEAIELLLAPAALTGV